MRISRSRFVLGMIEPFLTELWPYGGISVSQTFLVTINYEQLGPMQPAEV